MRPDSIIIEHSDSLFHICRNIPINIFYKLSESELIFIFIHNFNQGEHYRNFSRIPATIVARAAPEFIPKRKRATATASSKKLLASIKVEVATFL